jgi:hypothetical protein
MGDRPLGATDHADRLGNRALDLRRGRRARRLAPPRHADRCQLAGCVVGDPAGCGSRSLRRASAAYRGARLGGGGTQHYASTRSDAGLPRQHRDRCGRPQGLDPDRRPRHALARNAEVGRHYRVQPVRAPHHTVFRDHAAGTGAAWQAHQGDPRHLGCRAFVDQCWCRSYHFRAVYRSTRGLASGSDYSEPSPICSAASCCCSTNRSSQGM